MKYEILNEIGVVVNTILADADFVEAQYPGRWREIVEPEIAPLRAPITKLEYMNRFTDAELGAIYTAAKSVVAVEVWLDKFRLAAEVDLTSPLTASGLDALTAAGLLASGRKEEILA